MAPDQLAALKAAAAELRRREAVVDEAIRILGQLEVGPNGAPKMQRGWKHKRRCQECKQLTPTDPCAHCGAAIAPAGAKRDTP